MCGIFGAITASSKSPPPSTVFEGMARLLLHRGPDGTVIETVASATLGLNRLSIVGTDEPAQVFSTAGVSSVMNGEIYNHRALRKAMGRAGHSCAARSDAALVPLLFEEYGPRFVEHLQGPFAIALYERRARKLHLFRDRLGKKPLFFAQARHSVFFASEQKALLSLPGFRPRIDFANATAFLARGWLEDAQLLFAGIEAVAPGEWVTIDASLQVTRARWWSLHDIAAQPVERAAGERMGALIKDAVHSRLPDEVKSTLLLSGGLDSTVIGHWARRNIDSALCLDQENSGAGRAAKASAQALSLPLRLLEPTEPTPQRFAEALWYLETPDASAAWSMAPELLRLAQAVRASGAKVALCGEGADELFLGYGWDRLQAAAECGRHYAQGDVKKLLGKRAKYYEMLHAVATLNEPFPRARNVWFGLAFGAVDAFIAGHAHKWLLDTSEPSAPPTPASHALGARRRQLNGLGLDMLTLPVLHADRLLMAAGVEARLPFLDHRLVELALRTPSSALETATADKPLLRRWAKRWLPTWKAPVKAGFTGAAAPPAKTLRAMVGAVRQCEPWVVNPAVWRTSARWSDPVRLDALWRLVALEATAQVMLRGNPFTAR